MLTVLSQKHYLNVYIDIQIIFLLCSNALDHTFSASWTGLTPGVATTIPNLFLKVYSVALYTTLWAKRAKKACIAKALNSFLGSMGTQG